MEYKTLVLSGGGVSAIGIVGILYDLENKGFLKDIETYVGSSAGSLIALLLNIGLTPLEIYFEICEMLPINVLKVRDQAIPRIKTILNQVYGVEDITYIELYELTKKTLIMNSYNIVESQECYYSHIITPETSIIKSLSSSIRIPILLEEGKFEEVDGSLSSPFPILYCKDNGYNNILGIIIFYEKKTRKRNIWNDITGTITTLLSKVSQMECRMITPGDVIYRYYSKLGSLNFEVTFEDAINMFYEGIQEKEEYRGEQNIRKMYI